MSDQQHILPLGPGDGKLSQEKLLAYLEGKLPPEQQHEVEQWLSEEGMENDALEGLQAMPAMERSQSISKLNHRLRKTLSHKTRKRRKLKTDYNLLAAVLIILLLVTVAYLVIRYMR